MVSPRAQTEATAAVNPASNSAETTAAGRTKTLPLGSIDRFGLGVFSCSSLPSWS